jgi:hypothetical protein
MNSDYINQIVKLFVNSYRQEYNLNFAKISYTNMIISIILIKLNPYLNQLF